MRALITGASGQDGFYLASLLNSLGYRVYGGIRRGSRPFHEIDMEIVPLEMTEYESISKAVSAVLPDEIYNLAAMSHVGESFNCPEYTQNVNGTGVLRLLERIRNTKIRMYQASTSEMFGNRSPPQNEGTEFDPRSPYAASKVYAHQMCSMYRDAYGVRVSCGILFNHESPLRGTDFVTRKITSHLGAGKTVKLGNMETRRDWGHAKDYVRAMHLLLQNPPGDYVVATGESHSIRDFFNEALKYFPDGKCIEDAGLHRPLDVKNLIGDASKISGLGWKPEYTFEMLVREMCEADATDRNTLQAATKAA